MYTIKDNAESTLLFWISRTSTVINVVDWTKFPQETPFLLVLNSRNEIGEIIKSEKIEVTAIDGDRMTISRGFEGDEQQQFEAGDFVSLFILARHIEEIKNHVLANTGAPTSIVEEHTLAGSNIQKNAIVYQEHMVEVNEITSFHDIATWANNKRVGIAVIWSGQESQALSFILTKKWEPSQLKLSIQTDNNWAPSGELIADNATMNIQHSQLWVSTINAKPHTGNISNHSSEWKWIRFTAKKHFILHKISAAWITTNANMKIEINWIWDQKIHTIQQEAYVCYNINVWDKVAILINSTLSRVLYTTDWRTENEYMKIYWGDSDTSNHNCFSISWFGIVEPTTLHLPKLSIPKGQKAWLVLSKEEDQTDPNNYFSLGVSSKMSPTRGINIYSQHWRKWTDELNCNITGTRRHNWSNTQAKWVSFISELDLHINYITIKETSGILPTKVTIKNNWNENTYNIISKKAEINSTYRWEIEILVHKDGQTYLSQSHLLGSECEHIKFSNWALSEVYNIETINYNIVDLELMPYTKSQLYEESIIETLNNKKYNKLSKSNNIWRISKSNCSSWEAPTLTILGTHEWFQSLQHWKKYFLAGEWLISMSWDKLIWIATSDTKLLLTQDFSSLE